MIDFVSKKWFYFAFSTLILIPGLVSLAVYKLNLGIDFVGGTLIEIRFEKAASKQGLESAIEETGVEVSTVQTTDQNTFLIRTKPLDEEQHKKLIEAVGNKFGLLNELRRETVGPTIGAELLRKAVIALVLASVAIVFYVAWAFRKVPKPASSWQFGISAIVALLHDVFVVVGVFSILGHFFAVEVDALLVTALLTIIGFSVHDTIVVFDRIRENLLRETYTSFADTVNHSIMQTLARSLNTSLTVVFVLLAVLLFGGSSIRWFTVALLIGVISGTYSSPFVAVPLLVTWDQIQKRIRNKIV